MQPTPISTILTYPKGTPLECLSGTIINVGKLDSGTNSFGDWTMQKIDLRDQTGQITLVFSGRDELAAGWKGHHVTLRQGINNKDKPDGLEVEEYKDKKRVKVKFCALLEAGGAAPGPAQPPPTQQPPPPTQHVQQPPPTQQPPRQQQQPAPPPTQQAEPTPPPAGQKPQKVYFGQTIGMAMNNAVNLIRDSHKDTGDEQFRAYLASSAFARDVHRIASDLLAVAGTLESGKLAPSPKEREKAAASDTTNMEHMPEKRW